MSRKLQDADGERFTNTIYRQFSLAILLYVSLSAIYFLQTHKFKPQAWHVCHKGIRMNSPCPARASNA